MYGLPQLRLAGTPAVAPPPVAPATTTDPVTGLAAATLRVDSRFTTGDAPGNQGQLTTVVPTVTSAGTALPATAGLAVVNDRPIQPKVSLDVTPGTGRAHGALVLPRASTDVTGYDPVLNRSVIDDGTAERERRWGDVVFPAAIGDLTTTSGAAGVRDRLTLVPARFVSTPTAGGATVGTQTLFGSLDVTVYSSASANFVKPQLLDQSSAIVGAGVAFATRAVAAPGRAVKRVVVSYRDPAGTWRHVDLTSTGGDVWTGGGPADADPSKGDAVEWLVQAVDEDGNVGISTNRGLLHLARPLPAQPAEGLRAIVTGTQGANGWFLSAGVVATGANLIEVAVDGGPWEPYTGEVVVTGDGVHVVDARGWDPVTGLPVTARALVALDATKPVVHAPPGAEVLLRAHVDLAFACRDVTSGVASCSASPATLDTSTVGDRTVTFTGTDRAGNIEVRAVTFRVVYEFVGFQNGVRNGVLNEANAGSTVPMKWQLRDAAGAYITALSAVRSVTSYRINCPSGMPSEPAETTTASGGLSIGGTTYHHNWATDGAWAGTCRRYALLLDDGMTRTADFRFK